MRTVTKLTNNRFLNIKEVKQPERHVNGYQFAERLGTNSVAFVCYDKNTKEFLVNDEYKPPTDEFVLGAFGGSLDKDRVMVDIIIDEVKEEAGFSVSKDDVKFVGRMFVSTQMNQYCYLYIVFVDRKNQEKKKPENAVEAMATTEWVDEKGIMELNDWKAITILAKAKSLKILG